MVRSRADPAARPGRASRDAPWGAGTLGRMTITTYWTATTLDGRIADEHGSLDWLFAVEREGPDRFAEFFAGVGAFVMGATTYRWVLEHEALASEPAKWREWYGDTPCWVFTHRELPAVAGADVRFVRGEVAPVHAAMAEAAAGCGVWVVGGGELAGAFADAGLLDRLVLGVAPVTLTAGAPLLPRWLLSTDLRLESVERDGQFAFLTYELRRPAGG